MFRLASCILRFALFSVLLASFAQQLRPKFGWTTSLSRAIPGCRRNRSLNSRVSPPVARSANSEINEAVQGVMATGHFETAEIIPTGNGLRIVVVERPTVNVVTIEGNRRLSDDVLLEVVTSEARRVYTPAVAEADAVAIADAYATAARLAARVTPKIIRRSENRVDIVFEVSEGRVVENERISFVGNRAYSDRRLRRAISTKQAGFLRAIISSDTYVPERIAFDRQLLVDFYRSRGYVDIQILDTSVELSRERDATFVTFTIREGQKYSVGEITLSSEFDDTDIQDYEGALRIRSGNTWSPTLVDEQIARLERLALQQGFDFLRVDPVITRNERDLSLGRRVCACARAPDIRGAHRHQRQPDHAGQGHPPSVHDGGGRSLQSARDSQRCRTNSGARVFPDRGSGHPPRQPFRSDHR